MKLCPLCEQFIYKREKDGSIIIDPDDMKNFVLFGRTLEELRQILLFALNNGYGIGGKK